MTLEEEITQGFIIYVEEQKPCGQCSILTNWVDVCLYTFMCSKKCEIEWTREMNKNTRD